MALGHRGLQSIYHSDRAKECTIRTVHRNTCESCTAHCPVFFLGNVPQGSNYCASLHSLPPAKYKPLGLTAARKAVTCKHNHPPTSPTHLPRDSGNGCSWVRPRPRLPNSYLLDSFKVRKEKVSVIVGHLVLQHRDQPLQAHPSINTFLRKRFQCPISFSAQPQKER